jgi:hypothetical protein
MIIRVESHGIKNEYNGAVTHFRIIVDDEEIVQHSVVHRTDDKEQSTSFFGATSVSPGDHKIEVQAKVSEGTTTFQPHEVVHEQFIHGMFLPNEKTNDLSNVVFS